MVNQSSHGGNAAKQILARFVLPEIDRRLERGTLPPEMIQSHPEGDKAGQVLMPTIALVLLADSDEAKVLFDGETGIQLLAKVPTDITIDDTLTTADLAEISGFRAPQIPTNAGWILLINHRGRLTLSFDLRRNREFAIQHLEMGKAFVDCAAFALGRNEPRVALENLFHGVEKTVKAFLLTLPLGLKEPRGFERLKRKKHGEIRDLYSAAQQEADGLALMDELQHIRPSSSYFRAAFVMSGDEVERLIERARAFLDTIGGFLPEAEQVVIRTWVGEVSGESRQYSVWEEGNGA